MRPAGCSRRAILRIGLAGVAASTLRGLAEAGAREHRPRLDVPLIAENPTAVPVRVSVDHPMEPDHHVRSIEVRLDGDPVPHKGVFRFTPAARCG